LLFGSFGARQANAADPDPNLVTSVTLTAQAAVNANNNHDFGALSVLFTDQGFQEFFGETKAEAAADPEFFTDDVSVKSVSNVVATADGATAEVDFVVGLGIDAHKLTFITQNGRLIISGSTVGTPQIAAGTKVLDMKLQEYAFVFDTKAASSGNIAFNVTNTGKQEHEMILIKTDPSTTAADLLASADSEEEGPPPFEDFGFLGFYEPGQTATVALSHPLADGKYFFLCFVPDAADGVPHAAMGMIQEFTVGNVAASPAATAGAGTPIKPPSTGDAGLLGTQVTPGLAAIVVSLLLGVISLSAMQVARR
jgi:hypothetical protein